MSSLCPRDELPPSPPIFSSPAACHMRFDDHREREGMLARVGIASRKPAEPIISVVPIADMRPLDHDMSTATRLLS